MSDPEQTPMDRLRDIGLLPDVDRDVLREIVAAAVQEVQERLDALETARTQHRRRRPRGRP